MAEKKNLYVDLGAFVSYFLPLYNVLLLPLTGSELFLIAHPMTFRPSQNSS